MDKKMLAFVCPPKFSSAIHNRQTSRKADRQTDKQYDHLIRTIHNRYTSRKAQDTSSRHPDPEFAPEKENNTSTSAQSDVSPPFPAGVEQLVLLASWLVVSRFATLLKESGF